MKIIGWSRKGNIVRFILGEDDLEYWSGDDWSDRPYEDNALTEPLFGDTGFADVAFAYDVSVMEPADDKHYKHGSPFSMDDFKEREAPILIIDPTGEEEWYSLCVNKPEVFAIFMGDRFEDINWKELEATVLDVQLDNHTNRDQYLEAGKKLQNKSDKHTLKELASESKLDYTKEIDWSSAPEDSMSFNDIRRLAEVNDILKGQFEIRCLTEEEYDLLVENKVEFELGDDFEMSSNILLFDKGEYERALKLIGRW